MKTWQAQWIWLNQTNRRPQNQTIIARKTFDLPAASAATLAITADTQYRVFINGKWVEDGPCRSWPQHYQYDVIDVTTLLRPGQNVIAVLACHFGVSNFHQVPQEAGLLVQLDVTTVAGDTVIVASDESWRVHESPAHVPNTARISCQNGQSEWYDGTLELMGALAIEYHDRNWPLARAYYSAGDGPWHDLHPRDVRFLTREPISPECLFDALVVTDVAKTVAFDMRTLCYPEDFSANCSLLHGMLSTVLVSECAQTIELVMLRRDNGQCHLTLNGQTVDNNTLVLQKGENLLSILVHDSYGHGLYTCAFGFRTWQGVTQRNPYNDADSNPWGWIGPFNALTSPVTNLTGFPRFPAGVDPVAQLAPLGAASDAVTLRKLAGDKYRPIPTRDMLQHDALVAFFGREPQGSATELLDFPAAMLTDNQEWTVVRPSRDGDVELCFDFGKETMGWIEFEMIAKAGTVVDAHMIEYRDGAKLQGTGEHHNGFRYIAHDGLNTFISSKRRAGRYLFLTLREMTSPVKIRKVRMLQATYPVEQRGTFRCADSSLNKIWEISTYTLRMCMEDTYTDCPLYEQTLWVGDARNESLYNAICYGADDLTLRCLRLTGQSLDTLPITGCQVPSGWDVLLPAWSFLWGINVWEYYFSSGDLAGLHELYPAVVKNLRGAERYCTDRGLFSIDAWNLFDWANIDYQHKTVVHNSLFLIGAIDAAIRCCAVLGEHDTPWLTAFRAKLAAAVLALWDERKGSYPDSIHEDGTISDSVSQHTNALAILYDVLPSGTADIALRNIIDPPEGMVRVGSPFALQFFLEALEKAENAGHALALVRALWQDMLDCGATTCWETFRRSDGEFPTRSHCHAWSSAPIYVFNRMILGIQPVAPGAVEVMISPHPLGLDWAEGSCASPKGNLHVSWRLADGTLSISARMPDDVQWSVKPNADWHDITRVLVNGQDQSHLLKATVTA